MSRYAILLEKFQDGEETAAEAEELAVLVREDPERAAALYDAVMLDADLYDSYSAIARIQGARRRGGSWSSPTLVMIWSAAVFLFVAIAVLLVLARPSPQIAPVAPIPPPPKTSEPTSPNDPQKREHRERDGHKDGDDHKGGDDDHKEGDDRRSKKDQIEREYQKGMREVERKQAAGKFREAEEKLLEIQREREKQLQRLESRSRDR